MAYDYRASSAKYYQKNREKILAKSAARYAEDPELKARLSAYKESNRPKLRAQERARRGIKNAHGEKKSGACEICGLDRVLHLDHDHNTGEIRGWLCIRCNLTLGALESNGWRERADQYLKKDR